MNREAFEKWVCNLNRAPTAWEGWQAALQHAGQAQAELVEIGGERYLGFNESEFKAIPTGTKFYTCPQPAVQHAGQGEAEPVYAFRRKGLDDFCTCDERRYLELKNKPNLFEVAVFYTTPQPAVPDGWIKVMRGMAEYAECNDPRNPYLQQAQALLRAGKGGE